jgi:hypothetical protein
VVPAGTAVTWSGYATSRHRATADRCWPRSWRRPSGWPGRSPGEVRERHRFDADLAWLPEVARRLADPTPLTATVSPALTALHRRIAERMAPT